MSRAMDQQFLVVNCWAFLANFFFCMILDMNFNGPPKMAALE